MRISHRNIEVEWGDCDPADIVYFPNYFSWFDSGLMHHFASVGLPKKELLARYGLTGWPLLETKARFMKPSTYGETIVLETEIVKFGRTSFDIDYRIKRGADTADRMFGEARTRRPRSRDGQARSRSRSPTRSRRCSRDCYQPQDSCPAATVSPLHTISTTCPVATRHGARNSVRQLLGPREASIMRRLCTTVFPAIGAAMLIALSGAVSVAAAQSTQPGLFNPQRDCQTIRTCRFERGGSYRGCLSSYTCRTCKTVKTRCEIGGRSQNCHEMRCTWGG